MVRRKAEETASQPETVGPSVEQLIQHAQQSLGGEVVNEPPAAAAAPNVGQPVGPQEGQPPEAEGPTKKPFQVVRGWTTRNKQPVQFRKVSDADLGVILFKFILPEGQTTLPADVKAILDAHRNYPNGGEPTGLHFEDSRKHGKVWVLRNDPEGRDIADKIDRALMKLAAKHDLQAEQAATGSGRGQ